MQIVKKGRKKEMPARLAVYGQPKAGKTTFASQAPDALFINIEDGLDYLDVEVDATDKLASYDAVINSLKHILDQDEIPYKTIVIDSMDWFEALAQKKLVQEHGAKSITDSNVKDFAYHKGVESAARMAMLALKYLDAIYVKHDAKCIIIAHSNVKNLDLPGRDPFQRHELKLSKVLGSRLTEWADLILFADYDFHVVEGKTTEPKRVLRTGGDASFVGGGRMRLPKTLPIEYAALEKAIKGE